MEERGRAFDIVPALENAADHFVIPDTTRQAWIVTNPEKHKQVSILANEAAGKKLKPLVKAAKQGESA